MNYLLRTTAVLVLMLSSPWASDLTGQGLGQERVQAIKTVPPFLEDQHTINIVVPKAARPQVNGKKKIPVTLENFSFYVKVSDTLMQAEESPLFSGIPQEVDSLIIGFLLNNPFSLHNLRLTSKAGYRAVNNTVHILLPRMLGHLLNQLSPEDFQKGFDYFFAKPSHQIALWQFKFLKLYGQVMDPSDTNPFKGSLEPKGQSQQEGETKPKALNSCFLPHEQTTQLMIHHKGLKNLPEGIDVFENVGFIHASHNALKTLPSLIKLEKLSLLILTHNQFDKMPVEDLPFSLSLLNMDENFLKEIPITFQKFQGVKELSLGHNQIKDLTPLNGMSKLQTLKVSGNPIEKWPVWRQLASLEKLWAAKTGLTAFPKSLQKAKSLKVIDFSHNQITGLSYGAKTSKGLGYFELFCQWVAMGDEKLLDLPFLTRLDLSHNPLDPQFVKKLEDKMEKISHQKGRETSLRLFMGPHAMKSV